MTGPKLVQIRDGAPLLNDIPGQLEQLAADIRSGKESPVLALVVTRDKAGSVDTFGYGAAWSDDECAGLLLRAAQHCSMRADCAADDDDESPPPKASA